MNTEFLNNLPEISKTKIFNKNDKFLKEAKSAAESFESVFVFEFLESMYSGVKLSEFSGGSSEKTYMSMLNEEIAKSVSKQGGIGISESIFREIIKSQEI